MLSKLTIPRQLAIHVVLRHTEGLRHVLQGQASIGLEQLGVCFDLHLTDVVGVMCVHVPEVIV